MKKNEIIQYLTENGEYHNIDEYNVDLIVYNLDLIKTCKSDIKKNGITLNVSKDPNKPYYQTNQAVNVLNTAIKNVLQLSKKLGLSPLDRKNLKIVSSSEVDDGFDD